MRPRARGEPEDPEGCAGARGPGRARGALRELLVVPAVGLLAEIVRYARVLADAGPLGLVPDRGARVLAPLVTAAARALSPAPPAHQFAAPAHDRQPRPVGRQRYDADTGLRFGRRADQGAQPAAQLLEVGPFGRVLTEQGLHDRAQRPALLGEGGRLGADQLDQLGRAVLRIGAWPCTAR